MALWVPFNDRFPLTEIIPKLAASGLIFRNRLFPDFEHQQGNSARIGFASLDEEEITRAVGLLETLLKQYDDENNSQGKERRLS
jgi:DNA-binding transcriptional MocR family regulator